MKQELIVKNKSQLFKSPDIAIEKFSDSKYEAKIVGDVVEFESVLALRRDVFKNELTGVKHKNLYADFDDFDPKCIHLLVTERATRLAVGTYRLNSFRNAGSLGGFYASQEFCLEDLPPEMLERSVEIGRACIVRKHRNSRVLFLLWKLLAAYMESENCRYLFGCCSVFTQDPQIAANVLAKLKADGHVHESMTLRPRPEVAIIRDGLCGDPSAAEIPPLVNIYMRIGAKVCGKPAIDPDLKTVDYFVVFDLEEINRKYRKMFFGG